MICRNRIDDHWLILAELIYSIVAAKARRSDRRLPQEPSPPQSGTDHATSTTIATPPANVPTEAEPIRSDLEARVADLERTVEFLLAELGMEAPEDEMTDDR